MPENVLLFWLCSYKKEVCKTAQTFSYARKFNTSPMKLSSIAAKGGGEVHIINVLCDSFTLKAMQPQNFEQNSVVV